jgi:hypothetical protein
MAPPRVTVPDSGVQSSAHASAAASGRRSTRRSRPLPLITLELLIGVAALSGAVGLMWNDAIRMPNDWLQGTPFTSWLLPGVFLLFVVAAPMAAAAVLELRRSAWAAVASVVAGALEVGWITAELFVLEKYNVLQPVMLGLGLAVMLIALWVYRTVPLLPRTRG